jgi:dihydrofolate reductase
MGRKTYEQVLSFGMEWPYEKIPSFVVSSNKELPILTKYTFLVTDGLSELVSRLKSESPADIWLIGGGNLVTCFLNLELIDRMILTFIPVIIGSGIPLFPGHPKDSNWRLQDLKGFSTGAVSLTYVRK